MIPEGPLHPTDFGIALLLGGSVVVVFWRNRWWLPAAALVGLAGFGWRHGLDTLVDGFVDRPNPVLAVIALVVTGTIGWQLDRRGAVGGLTIPMLTVIALAAVWGVVPDTEAPLMFGTTLAVALVGCPRREPSAVPGGAILGVAVVAASVGTIGRPGRLLPAMLAIGLLVLAFASMVLARTLVTRSGRGRRAQGFSGRAAPVYPPRSAHL